MKIVAAAVLCLLVAVTVSDATVVRKCPNGPRKLTTEEVDITNCKGGTCKLKRNTDVGVSMTVVPDTDVKDLTTDVKAILFNLPVPFVGVDGTSACGNIYAEDGETQVGCPLKAGTKYIYKNKFHIENFYPSAALTVHWGLSSKGKDVACFEVPAKIVSK